MRIDLWAEESRESQGHGVGTNVDPMNWQANRAHNLPSAPSTQLPLHYTYNQHSLITELTTLVWIDMPNWTPKYLSVEADQHIALRISL